MLIYSIGEKYLYLNVMEKGIVRIYKYWIVFQVYLYLRVVVKMVRINSEGTLEEEEEESIHSKRTRERLVEEDALTGEEEWFVEGYEEDIVEYDEEDHHKNEYPSNGKMK